MFMRPNCCYALLPWTGMEPSPDGRTSNSVMGMSLRMCDDSV